MFTEENLKKFGLNIDTPQLLTKYARVIWQSSHRILGFNLGLVTSVKLMKEVTASSLKSRMRDESKKNFLFIEDSVTDDGILYRINKNFDWNCYDTKKSEEIAKEGEVSELELLRSIATMVKSTFFRNDGKCYLPLEIKDAIETWSRRFN